jgi:heme exporter protein A
LRRPWLASPRRRSRGPWPPPANPPAPTIRRRRPQGALAAAGLARVADLPAAQLSAGQRRRLALARLPLAGAPLWILDEPQTNLDDAGKAYLRGLLAGHLAGGGLAVVASHEPAGLAGVATARLELGGA